MSLDNNPHRAIIGKNPERKELSEWSSIKWVEFLKFVQFHISIVKKPKSVPKDHYQITKERIDELNAILKSDDHPWKEFIYRINQINPDGSYNNGYFLKLRTLVRIVLTYLKFHPAVVTDEMKAIIDNNPNRMGWCLKQYYLRNTGRGEIVQRDQMTMDASEMRPVGMPSLQKKQMDALIQMVDLHQELLKSIKTKDLKDLTVKDKLTALPKLVDAITKMTNKRVGINHLTQINIHGGAREMEETMLDYIKQKNDE